MKKACVREVASRQRCTALSWDAPYFVGIDVPKAAPRAVSDKEAMKEIGLFKGFLKNNT